MPRWRSPRDPTGRFVNWAGTVATRPASWKAPASEDELASIVRDARKIRPVGAGHSWSRIAAPGGDDVAISLDRLSGIVAIDRAAGLATVRAGTRLGALGEALAAEGLALPIVGSILHQSIAGAIATGTHGSSLAHGNLASLATRVRAITADGDARELPAGAFVHLGALGVVSEVTLRVVPAFALAETVEHVPVGDAIGHVAEIARSAEYVKIWWVPHTRHAQIFRYARTDDPATPRLGLARWIDDHVVHARLFPALVAVVRRRPHWIPAVNRSIARVYLGAARKVGPAARMLTTPMPFVHREAEAAVPLARAADAFDRVVTAIDREGVRVNFPVEVRFVRGDAMWASPASGADTCQIGAYAAAVDVDRYFAAFWRALAPLGARPHWGKELDHDAAALRAVYPELGRLIALRNQLDPRRVFANRFLDRVLGV